MNVEGELEGETDTKGGVADDADDADDADFFFFMAGGMTGLGS